MEKHIFILFFICSSFTSLMAQKLKTKNDTISYAAGVSIAASFQRHGVGQLDIDLVNQAIRDILSKDSSYHKLSKAEGELIFNNYLTETKSKKGREFLRENAKKEGVVSLPSGLQYKILKSGGSLQKPTVKNSVKVHYEGRLIDGKIFDSSSNRGEPVTFPIDKVIKGWIEGIPLMSVGDQFEFYIPYELAYDERGIQGKIPPYATLIFYVELLEIIAE